MASVIPNKELGRRLAAARTLAGYPNRVEFVNALALHRFGEGPAKAVETGERTLHPHEREAIAKFCGVPLEFFEVPRAQLGASIAEATPVETRLEAIERQLAVLAGATPSGEASRLGRLADEAIDALDPATQPAPADSTPAGAPPARKRSA